VNVRNLLRLPIGFGDGYRDRIRCGELKALITWWSWRGISGRPQCYLDEAENLESVMSCRHSRQCSSALRKWPSYTDLARDILGPERTPPSSLLVHFHTAQNKADRCAEGFFRR